MDPTALIIIVLTIGGIAVAALYYYIFTLRVGSASAGRRGSKVTASADELAKEPEAPHTIEISSDSGTDENDGGATKAPPIACEQPRGQ